MPKNQYRLLVEQVRQCSPETILRAALLCNGHSILAPKALLDAGLSVEAVASLTTHWSNGSPKGSIFVDGQVVKELQGVYGREVLQFLAGAMDVEYRGVMDHGF